MQSVSGAPRKAPQTINNGLSVGSLLISLAILVAALVVLWQGFLFLRDGGLPQLLNATLAIVWGVGGIGVLYYALNRLVESLPAAPRQFFTPYVFVGPAILILTWFFLIPTLRTAWFSFLDNDSINFVGLENYKAVLGDEQMLVSFRNNALWLVFGTSFCVSLGLLIAILADRSRFERVAKSLIFLPLAISFVGAAVIWRFIYYYVPADSNQIGLLNAIVTSLGGEPQAWISLLQPWNNLLLILILIWMQTGYAMVIFSAALKSVPDDLLEAGRIDGGTEVRIFFSIIIPYIQGTIITVTTTILIFCLKIFDIVIAMTGGQFGTEVIATQFYRQFFASRNFGYGSAIAIILLIAVIPVMIYNLRQLNRQESL